MKIITPDNIERHANEVNAVANSRLNFIPNHFFLCHRGVLT